MPLNFNVALAQINPTVGDIAGNARLVLDYYRQAAGQGADIVVFPELCITGYPPEDLILMPAFRREAMLAVRELARHTKGGAAMVVGSVWEEENIYNAALLLEDGEVAHVQAKTMLPNYGIFDEKRLFSAGDGPKLAQWRGVKIGLLVCEDMWYPQLAEEYQTQGAELLIVINASPFEAGKLAQRRAIAAAAKLPLLYVNMVGGQDDIVFDGGSFMMDGRGEITLQMQEFEQGLAFTQTPTCHPPLTTYHSLWSAMTLGLRDYVNKNGFSGVVLGLSGGIDSAVTAAAAVDALGAKRVKAVLLPSPYTSAESIEDALLSAQLLGIETMRIPITPGMGMFEGLLDPVFDQGGWMENPLIGGNIQARLRGMILMAISNRFGWMLLSTANKSEISVGYSTLYGDSCGGYNVLKDLYKTQVYALAEWRNASTPSPSWGEGRVGVIGEGLPGNPPPQPSPQLGEGEVCIPLRSIAKPPSAELAPGQKDEDQLPPYAVLDAVLALHIEGRLSAQEIAAEGFELELVERITKMVRQSEYKRRQSCPGVKLSPMLFGKDRRYPLTNKF